MKKDSDFFLILGMHRSGTSCLTGALERCGVCLGDVRRTGKFNKKGYFEIRSVQQIHDKILGLNKGSWHNPPEAVKVHPYFYEQLEQIATQLKSKKPCALKDPRTLLLLKSWSKIIGSSCQYIGTFRNPIAVAQSLNKRNQIPFEKGLELWNHYNRILVNTHKSKPFPLIHFDLSSSKLYRQKIIRLALEIGLKPQNLRLRQFITSKLEHHSGENLPIPKSCQKLYAYLIENQYTLYNI